jgi:hypothetical protein
MKWQEVGRSCIMMGFYLVLFAKYNYIDHVSGIKWSEHVERVREKRIECRLLIRKPEGKTPLRRTRRRWTDNIKIDIGEIGWGSMGWIDLAQNRNP